MNVQEISGDWTLLASTPTTSGTVVSISGVKEDERLSLVYQADGADGTLSLDAGAYENGVATTIEAVIDKKYVMADVDGSKARQSDGTYDVTPHNSGLLWAFITPRGV